MKSLLGALALLAISGSASAQTTERICDGTSVNCPLMGWNNPFPVQQAPFNFTVLSPGQYTPVSDSTVQSLTVPSGARYAVVCVEGANHRYTWDGTTTPTSGIGQQLLQNQCISLTGANVLAAFQIIQQGASGSFTVSYAQ